MAFQFEKATHQDLDELEQLYDALNDHLEATINYPGWRKGVYPIREDAKTGISEETLFVIRQEEQIAGSIILNHEEPEAYQTVKWPSGLTAEEIGVIHTLTVHPNYLKLGVGEQLLKGAEVEARKQGMRALRLDVYEHNGPAIRLYEKCGFKFVGTIDLGLGCYGLEWFKVYEKALV